MIGPIDCAYLSAQCLARAGLRLDPDKAYLIESRLTPVARREGYVSLDAFVQAIRDGDDRLAWAAIEAMALPETEFFRDRAVFHHLIEAVLPALVQVRGGNPVRVWSAACGTGQEIYSLAMLIADAPGLAGKVELYASDLSERSLEKALAGIYSQFEVQRGLPARFLIRHFENRGEAFQLSPRIRQMVRWRRANLMDDLSAFGEFDLVLCRNLLGQLAPEALGRVRAQLTKATAPQGRLVLGLKDPTGDLAPVTPETGVFARAA